MSGGKLLGPGPRLFFWIWMRGALVALVNLGAFSTVQTGGTFLALQVLVKGLCCTGKGCLRMNVRVIKSPKVMLGFPKPPAVLARDGSPDGWMFVVWADVEAKESHTSPKRSARRGPCLIEILQYTMHANKIS